jgi:tripartite-type tricarboxylate transporter receptor subunit TctC
MSVRVEIAVLSALRAVVPAAAQQFPAKPIRMIGALSPGGGVDLVSRTLAQELIEAWGQPVVVENRTGASGNIGTHHAAKAAPDGYTLPMAYVGNMAIDPALVMKLPFDPVRDFTPVTLGGAR